MHYVGVTWCHMVDLAGMEESAMLEACAGAGPCYDFSDDEISAYRDPLGDHCYYNQARGTCSCAGMFGASPAGGMS